MKTYQKYSIIILGIILFGLFVYPTLYEYDKLEQKFPVKINRISGEAKILTANGWVDPGDYNSAAEEMRQYRQEIINKLATDREEVKQEVISAIRSEIVNEVRNDLANVKSEIAAYKQYETDPKNSFAIGDTKETVKRIMGTPDTINDLEFSNEEWWYYGTSRVVFKAGKVSEWMDFGNNLRVK